MKKAVGWLLNNRAYFAKLSVLKLRGTIHLRFSAMLKGVELGQGAVSFGRTFLYRHHEARLRIGNNCDLRSHRLSNLIGVNRPCILNVQKGAELLIGDNCGFSGTVIGAFKSVKIGNNVKCGANTLITDSDWHPEDPRSQAPEPVIIGDNVWLGEGARVLKGVTIGENSLIGAGSIVTSNIPPNVIAAGNPCRVIKTIAP